MYNVFNMRTDDATLQARMASPKQLPLALATQIHETSNDTLLDSVATLSKINATAVVQHGARLSVMGELLVSMLTHLPRSMRADIANSFRDRIEGLMSLGDDKCLPEQYHSAL